MPNTDKIIFLPQLQRYDQKIKGWADNKFLTKVDAPSLTPATATTLGGVKVGNGLNVTDDGTLSTSGTASVVGSETGTVAHVEDAFAGASLRGITVEGACKQDGIPSPDAPKPITVVENPMVKVVGRNVLDIAALAKESPEYYKADGGTLTVLESDNRDWASFAATQELKAGTYILSGDFIELKDIDGNSLSLSDITPGAPFTLPVDTKVKVKVGFGIASEPYPYTTKAMIERSSSASDYAPYTSQTLTFTLPAEHPYLAKLPDGTTDEIVVDEEGNVELVAMVQKVDVSNLPAPSSQQELSNGLTRYSYNNVLFQPARAGSPALTPGFESVVSFGFPKQGLYATNKTILVGAAADPTETLRAGGYLYTTLATPVRYPLGRIEMPKAQDSIVNAWTDAEVTPNTSIEYVRDVNIVIENLESANLKSTDVRINGKSITADGVADIPIGGNVVGVVKRGQGIIISQDGSIHTKTAMNAVISARNANDEYDISENGRNVISPSHLDYAVKAAMCDGKGAAWTTEEQAAARERMGIGDYSLPPATNTVLGGVKVGSGLNVTDDGTLSTIGTEIQATGTAPLNLSVESLPDGGSKIKGSLNIGAGFRVEAQHGLLMPSVDNETIGIGPQGLCTLEQDMKILAVETPTQIREGSVSAVAQNSIVFVMFNGVIISTTSKTLVGQITDVNFRPFTKIVGTVLANGDNRIDSAFATVEDDGRIFIEPLYSSFLSWSGTLIYPKI